MIRYCNFCASPIPAERLKRNKKCRFCSDACRVKERDEWKEQKRTQRLLRNACPTCGRKLSRGKQEGVIPRVETVLEISQ